MTNDELLCEQVQSKSSLFFSAIFPGIFLLGSLYWLATILGQKHIDLDALTLISPVLILTPFFIWILSRARNYRIYTSRIEISGGFGFPKKQLSWYDVTGWYEHFFKTKNGLVTELCLVTAEREICINKTTANYEKLRSFVTKLKPDESNKYVPLRYQRYMRYFLYAAGVAAVLLATGAFSMQYTQPRITEGDITIVNGVLSQTPGIHHYKSSTSVIFKLNQYPDFDFILPAHNSNYDEVIQTHQNLKAGDTIQVGITRNVYLKKLLQSQPLVLADRFGPYTSITIYSLAYNATTIDNLRYQPNAGQFYTISIVLLCWGIMLLIVAVPSYLQFASKLSAATEG